MMLVMLLNQRGVDHVGTRNKGMRSECPPSQLNREIAATPPKKFWSFIQRLSEKENKADRVTQRGRNAIPETVAHPFQRSKNLSQVNLCQRTEQKTAVQAPSLKDKKKEITCETNE